MIVAERCWIISALGLVPIVVLERALVDWYRERGWTVVEFVPAEQLEGAVEALRELEVWAARMPDAGFTSDDPRWAWWHERPVRYGGQ